MGIHIADEDKEIWKDVVSFRGDLKKTKDSLTALITQDAPKPEADPWRTSIEDKEALEEAKFERLNEIDSGIKTVDELSNKSALVEMEVNRHEDCNLNDEWDRIMNELDNVFSKLNEVRDLQNAEMSVSALKEA